MWVLLMSMDELVWLKEDELFTDIYEYDTAVIDRISSLLQSHEHIRLMERAQTEGSVLSLLDEVIPARRRTSKRLKSLMNPFYAREEYDSKEEYLQYLKQAYGFMMNPLEEPPGRILGLFFPHYSRHWSPSRDSAEQLLSKFFIEVNLIRELSKGQWRTIASSTNPEAALARTLYGARFRPEFSEFLRKIPWILSRDVYSSPALDLMYWTAPGQKLPRKPFGIDDGFLENLASVSRENKALVLITTGEDSLGNPERTNLAEKQQITELIEKEGTATLDTFVGLSKIERDFVIHQHIVVWNNPGYARYRNASLFKRIRYLRPHRYLCVFREQAVPLEIAAFESRFR